ncbi:anthocyanin 3'-O-beta-glucosyltransferase-like [Silene latifolia]|uniref:anthocyanin 3'-O-beta-glucosyltransferase-like n=1 Tax=Silene latifolia TaxID=37657 RepID=UPI003D77C0FE
MRKVKIFFFPHIAGGHLLPMVDAARFVASHPKVKVTIITTPRNAKIFENAITRDREEAGHDIGFHLLDLDRLKFGLPEDVENTLHSLSAELRYKVFMSVLGLKEPLLGLLETHRPDCLVSDVVQSWTLDVANKAGIPRIAFRGASVFSFCVEDCLRKFKPHENVESDDQPFLLPGLPDPVYMTRNRMPHCQSDPNVVSFFEEIHKAEMDSFAIMANSAHDLEPGYHNHAKTVIGVKLFALGPVSKSSNKTALDKSERGASQSVDDDDMILGWLRSKAQHSVVYVSFGSEASLCKEQFHEIALGLESSGHPFIWVAKSLHYTNPNEPGWFPTGFEDRIKDSNQGLIIKGWAPQLLILDHANVGAFMTHCGWNSSIECLCAGVPFITWPLAVDQFFNESLLVDVLKVGIRVGNEECTYMSATDFKSKVTVTTRDKVEFAVRRILSGDKDVQVMKKNVQILATKAKKAVEEGGSSYNDVYALVDELIARQNPK